MARVVGFYPTYQSSSLCAPTIPILKRIQVDRSTHNLTGFCQSTFQYGDVAQLVRAGASYAQGRGFNFLHHYQAMNEDIRAVREMPVLYASAKCTRVIFTNRLVAYPCRRKSGRGSEDIFVHHSTGKWQRGRLRQS